MPILRNLVVYRETCWNLKNADEENIRKEKNNVGQLRWC